MGRNTNRLTIYSITMLQREKSWLSTLVEALQE